MDGNIVSKHGNLIDTLTFTVIDDQDVMIDFPTVGPNKVKYRLCFADSNEKDIAKVEFGSENDTYQGKHGVLTLTNIPVNGFFSPSKALSIYKMDNPRGVMKITLFIVSVKNKETAVSRIINISFWFDGDKTNDIQIK